MINNREGVKRMDKISVEEFKRNIKACLDQLPFEVTRRGKVLFVCYGPEGKPVDIPEKAKKQPCQPMPDVKIVPVKSLDEPVKAIIKDKADIDTKALRAIYKIKHPLDVCIKCQRFNRECIC
jgi:hypothetical protein